MISDHLTDLTDFARSGEGLKFSGEGCRWIHQGNHPFSELREFNEVFEGKYVHLS